MSAKVPTLKQLGSRLDIEVRQGSTLGPYRNTLLRQIDENTQQPFDLTGCEVRAYVRKNLTDEEEVARFWIQIAADPTQGYFDFGLAASVTAALTVGPTIGSPESVYLWDCEVELADGRVVPLNYGALRIQAEVTR